MNPTAVEIFARSVDVPGQDSNGMVKPVTDENGCFFVVPLQTVQNSLPPVIDPITGTAAIDDIRPQRVVKAWEWSITDTGAAGAAASVTRAAVAAQTWHVCTGIIVTLTAVEAQVTPIEWNLLDGVTVLQSFPLIALLGTVAGITRDGLHILGSENTAMTLEIEAPEATSFVAVTLTGYTFGIV